MVHVEFNTNLYPVSYIEKNVILILFLVDLLMKFCV